jgi:ribosomal protein L11 methyltransferase
MAKHLQLGFELGAHTADVAEQCCFELGALAVTLSNARAERDDQAVLEPGPGEQRLWEATQVEALFDGACSAATLIAQLAQRLAIEPSAISAAPVAERIWEREWLRDFHALRFGERLWVCPSHERIEQANAVVVTLDPGLAFGTGTHASTALCLQWLDAAAGASGNTSESAWPPARVIDYGCGSGVLAIAALKLGAGTAYAFDHDPQALLATRENAERNGVGGRLCLCEQAGEIPSGADLLLANILASVLIERAAQFAALLRSAGRLLLSGILTAQEEEVAAAFAKWFDIGRFASRDGWVALAGNRR